MSFSSETELVFEYFKKRKLQSVDQHLCFCCKREAACQNERTSICLTDLNSKRTSFRLISFLPPSFSPLVFKPFWNWRCSSNAVRCVSVLCLHVVVYVRGGSVFWQWKLPSEWDGKRSARHGMLVGPGILNSVFVSIYVCAFLWVEVWVCVCVYASS